MTDAVNEQLPPSMRISREILRSYENNEFPRGGPNPVVLTAMAVATGHDVRDLPPHEQEEVAMVIDLLARPAPKKRERKEIRESSHSHRRVA